MSGGLLQAQTAGSVCEKELTKAIKFYGNKQYDSAVIWLERVSKTCSRDTAVSDRDYYSILGLLAMSYHEIGNEDSTIIVGEAAVKYFEKVKAVNDDIYNNVLGRLGLAYVFYSEYENAIRSFEKCLSYFRKKHGASSEVVAWYDLELARCYSEMGDLEKAFSLNRFVKSVTNGSGRYTQYISVITNMGNDFVRMGQYDSAIIYHSESLTLRDKYFGKKHAEYAKGLYNLAFVYNDQNRFADAIIYFEQAAQVYMNAGYSNSVDYATVLQVTAMCYKELNNLRKAYNLLEKALEIKRAIYGHIHPEIAEGVNSVGIILEQSFDYKQALEAYLHAKRILERTIGQNNPKYATTVSNLGNCYANLEQYDSAFYFLNKALDIKEKLYGKDHVSLAVSLNNLGSLYGEVKKYKEAEEAFARSRSITEKIYGKDALQLSAAYQNLALLYAEKGNLKGADSLFNLAFKNYTAFVINNTEGLSEKDKEGFAEDIRINQYTSLSLRQKSPLSNGWLLNSTLFYKGLLLESSKGFASAFRNIKDSSLMKKAEEYFTLKRYAGAQLLKPEVSRSKELPQIIERATSLERQLLQASSPFRNWKEQFKTDWTKIQKQLTSGGIAIEFISYYLPGMKTLDSTQYAAMILKPGINDPLIVPLFNEAQFNRLVAKGGSTEQIVKKLYRSAVRVTAAQPTASDSLYHLIWKPLLPHLQNVKTVYFAADGVMNNLNLAAIITPDGKRLIEAYEFIQLSSTRNLIKSTKQPSFKTMQFWGGVNYNGASTSTSRSTTFSYLPGTLTEINDISIAASKSNATFKTISASDANEINFKKLDGSSPEILHIATHGFFFPDPQKAKTIADNRFAHANNPLLRSGLALANANDNWQNEMSSSDKEDGILTAYEIADMDLSNTKLVVLSACETGLGDIKSGEGVYGLQRAFKMAGVDYLIMSLWQVPDLETKEFMQTFYANCFSGMPIRKAFRETQLAMNKKYQPYQWAAFVLVE